jgi:hypothetical protein
MSKRSRYNTKETDGKRTRLEVERSFVKEDNRSFVKKDNRTISNQRQTKDCFAHVTTRVLSRLIKNIIPDHFSRTDGETDDCDNSYDVSMMDDVTNIIKKCSPESRNSLLLYIYIYKLITRKWGCNGGKITEVFEWFKDLIDTETLFDATLFDATLFDATLFGVTNNLNGLISKFFEDFLRVVKTNKLTFRVDMLFLTQTILQQGAFRSYFLDKLKILKDKYYIGIVGDFGGSPHAMTLIDFYVDIDNKIILKVKNSWGKNDEPINIGGLKQEKGIIIDSFDNFLKAGLEELTTLRLETDAEREEREEREERHARGEISDSDNDDNDGHDEEYGGGVKKKYTCNKLNKRISCKKRNTKNTKNIKKKNTIKPRKTRNTRNTRKI